MSDFVIFDACTDFGPPAVVAAPCEEDKTSDASSVSRLTKMEEFLTAELPPHPPVADYHY